MALSLRIEQAIADYEALSTWGKITVAGGIALAFYIPYKYYTTRPRKSPIKEDYKRGE